MIVDGRRRPRQHRVPPDTVYPKMSTVYWQDASIRFSEPHPAAWRIAADLPDLIEAVVGASWTEAKKVFAVRTVAGVSLQAADIPDLKAHAAAHGAPVSLVRVEGRKRYEASVEALSTTAILHFDGDRAWGISLVWSSPQRVDIESIHYALGRVMQSMRRRARWREADVKIEDVRLTTNIETSTTTALPMVRARGLWPRFRSWVVRNRDNLIISLGGGFAVTASWALLQAFGIVPTLE